MLWVREIRVIEVWVFSHHGRVRIALGFPTTIEIQEYGVILILEATATNRVVLLVPTFKFLSLFYFSSKERQAVYRRLLPYYCRHKVIFRP